MSFFAHANCRLQDIVKGLWALRLQMLTLREDNYLSDDTTTHTFSSQSQSQSQSGTDVLTAIDEEENAYHRKKLTSSPKLIDSLALWYLGMLLLRLPISVGHIMKWIVRDEVPLLRAIRFIPPVMKDRMPPTYKSALDTGAIPTGDGLHRAISDLALLYHREFRINFPKLNRPALQLAYIRELCLPFEIYPAMTSLQKLVRYRLAFLETLSAAQSDDRGRSRGKSFQRIHLPEVQLMSLLIVAVKLFYSLKEEASSNLLIRSYDEPSSLIMDWSKWMEVQKRYDEEGENNKGRLEADQALRTKELDVFGMSEEQMDDYMDWYERMFVFGNSTMTNPLAEMFPTSRTSKTAAAVNPTLTTTTTTTSNPDPIPISISIADIQEVMSHLTPRDLVDDDEQGSPAAAAITATATATAVTKPGQRYRRYKKVTNLPGEGGTKGEKNSLVRYFHARAADVIGVSMQTMLMGVYTTESRILDRLAETTQRGVD
ncbi:Pol I core factor CF [Ascosphaera aggregata]|nr:Pol I core factor CF [Ascosphaera aggregata]